MKRYTVSCGKHGEMSLYGDGILGCPICEDGGMEMREEHLDGLRKTIAAKDERIKELEEKLECAASAYSDLLQNSFREVKTLESRLEIAREALEKIELSCSGGSKMAREALSKLDAKEKE